VKSYYESLKSDLTTLLDTRRAKLHIGWIPHSKLPLLYRAADIFVRTSRYENFGLGVIEAMACGTPRWSQTLYQKRLLSTTSTVSE
jgi:glycosyltransferase involved in cell wall biosynthesis